MHCNITRYHLITLHFIYVPYSYTKVLSIVAIVAIDAWRECRRAISECQRCREHFGGMNVPLLGALKPSCTEATLQYRSGAKY
jgi:hypothetical protein